MKKNKELNIRGALLDKNQFEKYIEKVSAEHNIKNNCDKETYPIKILNENYKFIFETYRLLNRHIKLGIKIHSAGEWLLDNFYIIEEAVKLIQKELTLKKYKKMPGIASGRNKGFSRIYVLAEEITAFSDCKIDREIIDIALKSYQRKKLLSMEEISSIGIFLNISLISHIKELCEKIYSSQIQKYRVEEIIEKTIDKKDVKDMKFINQTNIRNFSENVPKYSFIEYMSYKLKRYGKKTTVYKNVLEKEVSKLGLTISDVIEKEHFFIANVKITMGNCITSIKAVNRINFSEIFSYINASEEILKQDPAGIYALMDLDTKNYYRNILEKLSKKSKISEIYIAEKIIELCKRYEKYNDIKERKRSHVGYYLVKEGLNELKKELEIKQIRENSLKEKSKLYSAINIIIPLYLDFLISLAFYLNKVNIFFFLIIFIILYIPISEIFLRIFNYILSKLKSPTIIPKMNYENGIPDDKKTIVVIPTILKNKNKVKEMFEKLEVYYLANKSQNLYFALLGDCSEESTQNTDFDKEIVEAGLEISRKLNEKYKQDEFNKFHFLYRKRVWNDGEKSYIGWERKRGLLVTFNKYIKKLIKDDFLVNTIELQREKIPDIKYIITLDSDTSLNLGTAEKLIGAMSHILNIPVIENNKVIDGYGIMQPRIGMDLSLAQKTKFIELYSMQGRNRLLY